MTSTLYNPAVVERRVPSSVGNPVDYNAVAATLIGAATIGCTIDGHGKGYSGDGIIVGVPEYGIVADPFDVMFPQRVLAWVKEVAPVVSRRADYWFGVWADCSGHSHLDVSQTFSQEDRAWALRAIFVRGELCAWDNGRREQVFA